MNIRSPRALSVVVVSEERATDDGWQRKPTSFPSKFKNLYFLELYQNICSRLAKESDSVVLAVG